MVGGENNAICNRSSRSGCPHGKVTHGHVLDALDVLVLVMSVALFRDCIVMMDVGVIAMSYRSELMLVSYPLPGCAVRLPSNAAAGGLRLRLRCGGSFVRDDDLNDQEMHGSSRQEHTNKIIFMTPLSRDS